MDEANALPEQSEAVQAEHSTDAATSQTESAPATDPAEEQRREQDKAKARENAAFAALRQREREARAEADRERSERQALMQRLMQGEAKPANGTADSPDPAKYAGGEFNPDYVKDLARYEAKRAYREEIEQHQKRVQEQNAQQMRQKAVQTWEQSQAAAQKKYAPKGAGAIVSFEIAGGVDAGIKFVDGLELFSHVANIGDVRSLVIHPASTTHSQLSPADLATTGVTPGLVRLSVGLESYEDLILDLQKGFAAAR
jgi:hypothetical protein